LGIVAFDVLPGVTLQRLLSLVFLSVVGQGMLWRYALGR
jgi:hypothetical protein